MAKMKMCARLEIEIIKRLQLAGSRKKISVSDVIAGALDAWEREQDIAEQVGARLECLEKNLLALVDLMEVFDAKIDRHFGNETERMKTMYLLMKANLNDHDQAEKERFENLTTRVF